MFLEKLKFTFDLVRLLVGDFLGTQKKDNKNINNLFKLSKGNKKNILVVSLSNSGYMVNVEALLGKALNNFDYDIYYLTNFKNRRAVNTFSSINAFIIYQNWLYFKNFFRIFLKKIQLPNTSDELKDFVYEGVKLGVGVYGSVSRKFKIGQINFDNKIQKIVSYRYLLRSIVYLEVSKEIISKINPSLVIANEKGYMASSEIFGLCMKEGIDFIQWVGTPEPNSLAFKKYNKNNIKEHPLAIAEETWSEYKNKELFQLSNDVKKIFERGYLEKKWFKYNCLTDNTQAVDREALIKKYHLNPCKKIVVLFSHVMWDANLFYGEDLFKKGFENWYIESVKVMALNQNVNWLIKIHPANRWKHNFENIKGDYREVSSVHEAIGSLPDNIKFVYPEDEISPYSLYQFIDCGITVRGTIGSELPCFGVPVLTAGTGRYSGLGFTNDSSSIHEYLDKLANIQNIEKLSEEIILANLYGYLFFKVRPLLITSFEEIWNKKEQEIVINVKNSEEMTDLKKFADWALNSSREDFLNKI